MTTLHRRVRKRLFAGRDAMPCAYCGVLLTLETSTLDHVRPKCRNGKTNERNCVIACRECNRAKGGVLGWQNPEDER